MPALRRGLTMIELTISLALGMAVILMVYAAFRVLVTSITTGRRMAIENTVLRAGLRNAIEEVDFWSASAAQAQRQGSMAFNGDLDYSAQVLADPVLSAQPEPPTVATVGALVDLIERTPTEDWWFWTDRLYDWRTLLATTTQLPKTTNTMGSTQLKIDFLATDPLLPGGIPDITTYALNRGFYKRSLVRERALLGFGHFGYLEYLPHHAVFAEWVNPNEPNPGTPINQFNASLSNSKALSGVPKAHPTISRLDEGSVDHHPQAAGAKNYAFQDYFKATTSSGDATKAAWCIVPLKDGVVTLDVPAIPSFPPQTWLPPGLRTAPDGVPTRSFVSLLDATSKPLEWPTLGVMVERRLGLGRFSTLVSVIVRNPSSAQDLTLHTHIMGTTLRGARRQRGLP